MSEIYIRSQNKEKLYRMGGNYACIEYGEREEIKKKRGGSWEGYINRHTVCISDGLLEEIGEYESKERCIEIIDEIQEVCGQYLYAQGNTGLLAGSMAVPPMAAVIPRVYQMPEK